MNIVVSHVLRSGYPEIVFRNDGGPAVRALQESVVQKLKSHGVQVIPSRTPAADSASAGFIESGVKLIEDKART